jgi:hypothetical protein
MRTFLAGWRLSLVVMAGFDPAVHALSPKAIDATEGVDHREKPGDDEFTLEQWDD